MARLAAPGGMAYVMEFHPLLSSIGRAGSPDIAEGLTLQFDYLARGEPRSIDTAHTYAPSRTGRLIEGATVSNVWAYTMLDVQQALRAAGLHVDVAESWEDDCMNRKRWDVMVPVTHGWWRLPDSCPKLGLVYAVTTRKPR